MSVLCISHVLLVKQVYTGNLYNGECGLECIMNVDGGIKNRRWLSLPEEEPSVDTKNKTYDYTREVNKTSFKQYEGVLVLVYPVSSGCTVGH